MSIDQTDPAPALAALMTSHHRLSAAIATLDDEAIISRAYPSEWTVADVMSHLGAAAEIFSLLLHAGLSGADQPGIEEFHPIWDRWSAKAPRAQVDDGVTSDRAFVELIHGLGQPERESWSLDLWGEPRDLAAFARLRLAEHAIHTWDIVVAFDPTALVGADAVALLVDQLGLVARNSRVAHEPSRILVRTVDPARELLVDLGGTNDVRRWDGGPHDATLDLPAEALVRLIYGRFDAGHGVPVVTDGVDLDDLRRTFPGV